MRSSLTLSGRLPTQRCRVSLTILYNTNPHYNPGVLNNGSDVKASLCWLIRVCVCVWEWRRSNESSFQATTASLSLFYCEKKSTLDQSTAADNTTNERNGVKSPQNVARKTPTVASAHDTHLPQWLARFSQRFALAQRSRLCRLADLYPTD